ncbi:MAG: polyprenyl synthetase family protein [Rhizobiaceae bacterium]
MAGNVVSLKENRSVESIDRLINLVREDMQRVNSLILSKTGSEVEMIPEVAKHLIDSGGKRLRPMITIAAAQMCGYEGDGHVTLAASVEFMHTATLLHDDVVDESDMRRGKLAARMLWGNEASVLVGDFLLGQAFRMMVDVGSLRALDVLSHAATVIAEGEVLQLSTAKNLETTEDEYLEVIRSKTAALFAAAAEVGPILARENDATTRALRSYGNNLGLAFQLIDDALDYGGNASDLGKNTGDDFREGKVTLPVLLAYRRGNSEERSFWQDTISKGEADEEAFASAVELLRKHDAISDTVARARHYVEMATDALGTLPDSEHKKALIDVLEFCVSRAN